MTIRARAAVAVAKCLKLGLKIMRRKGTNLPGVMALKICPTLFRELQKPKTIIGVTGTNGKTTVANLIGDVLAANNIAYAGNRFGSNIDTGIATTLIDNVTFFGKCKKQLAVLEIDERMTPRILPYVHLDFLVVTNLFRDSYKRNAHAEFIFDILERNIADDTTLILNGEDLISSRLKLKNKRSYFALSAENLPTSDYDNIINDVRFCPICEAKLRFTRHRYHHIGVAHCTGCDYASPTADYDVTAVDFENHLLSMTMGDSSEVYRLLQDSMINIYNQTAAIATLRAFGLTYDQVKQGMDKVGIVASRYDVSKVGNHQVVMNLAKGQNPVACSRVFDFIAGQPGEKAVLIMVDDHGDAKTSSENIAWIYDVDFEYLQDPSVKQILVGGHRHLDYRVRMELAGIDSSRYDTTTDPHTLPTLLDAIRCDTVYILYDLYTYDEAVQVRTKLIERLKQGGSQ